MSYATVFKDETKLDINYTPSKLQHRNFQLKLLNQYFRHAIETPGKMTQRVIITGKVGTGKTVLTQLFGREITREAQRRNINLRYIHLNCRQNKGSFFLTLQQIVTQFHPTFPKRGYSAEELLQALIQILDTQNVHLIVTLDELESLIQNEGSEPLYKLSRIEETRPKTPRRLSLICILRELDWLNKLDASTRSTLQSNIIQLDAYTKTQLKDILNDRITLAFKPGTTPVETIEFAAELGTEEGGNARYAIELIWRAGKYADTEGDKEVSPEHVRRAVETVYAGIRRDEIAALDLHKKLFLLGISRRFQLTKGAYLSMGEAEEAYTIVCEEFDKKPRGHTQLWKYAKELSNLGIIKAEPSTSGQRGKTTLIGLPHITATNLETELNKILQHAKRG
ncbi:MAG: ORC1-type DNA replication protein [Candidatus Bathyarchaeota archaeon]|nr:MAG: ORC1-type DNA replication protein [Candidatus Bathyarchaeota archaeon]